MSGKPLFVSEETLRRALELRSQNLPVREISQEVGVPRERLRKLLLVAGAPSKVPIALSLACYDHVDPIWFAEFRGFFLGEGCAHVVVQKTGRHTRPQYQPRLNVALREDDAEVVLDIQRHLGGNVIRNRADRRTTFTHPSAQWQLVGFSKLTNLLPLLFSSHLPAKKRRDLEILHEMCQARLKMPYNLTDEHSQELGRYYEALRSIKRFQGTDG